MHSKALFPISVDNQKFRTSSVLPALSAVVHDHDEIMFLVADRFQLYNKACRVGGDIALKEVLENFSLKSRYFEERRSWLENLRHRIGQDQPTPKWTILGVGDLTDSAFYPIYRNVLLSFHTIRAFRQDVEQTAQEHCLRKANLVSPEIEKRLSEAYILEEIAINIRIRVVENVESEFYMGEYLTPILNLYKGKYEIDVFALAELPSREVDFKFFEWIKTPIGRSWRARI